MKRGLFFPIAPLSIVLLAIVAIFSMSAAEAVPVSFFASLDGAAKVPPVMTPGTGLGVVVLEATAHTIQINVTFSGLTSPTTAAHIHCCQPLGTNAGVATTVPGFPAGGTSGSYMSAVFDLTQPTIYNPAFVTMLGGLPQAEAALVGSIQNGLTYLNVHTNNNMGGEIRGQLSPCRAHHAPAGGLDVDWAGPRSPPRSARSSPDGRCGSASCRSARPPARTTSR